MLAARRRPSLLYDLESRAVVRTIDTNDVRVHEAKLAYPMAMLESTIDGFAVIQLYNIVTGNIVRQIRMEDLMPDLDEGDLHYLGSDMNSERIAIQTNVALFTLELENLMATPRKTFDLRGEATRHLATPPRLESDKLVLQEDSGSLTVLNFWLGYRDDRKGDSDGQKLNRPNAFQSIWSLLWPFLCRYVVIPASCLVIYHFYYVTTS